MAFKENQKLHVWKRTIILILAAFEFHSCKKIQQKPKSEINILLNGND
jgi:hypothetical protein